ncbi:MAG: D-sedoheptulose 7-phosphate isomerase [Candidatus Micrarchaeota archaeon]
MANKMEIALLEGAKLRQDTAKACMKDMEFALTLLVKSYKSGGKMILCGNGGSAADSQHIAAEMVGKFNRDRRAFPALALSTDTSVLTAVGNDFGFEHVFERQIEANGNKGDVLIAITTSGNSKNILLAAKIAKRMGIQVVGLTGNTGGALKSLSDVCICVPSDLTPRIQELHIAIGHILCGELEAALL